MRARYKTDTPAEGQYLVVQGFKLSSSSFMFHTLGLSLRRLSGLIFSGTA